MSPRCPHPYGLSFDGRSLTLARFDGGVTVEPATGAPTILIAAVDTETTGLMAGTDLIIELAMVFIRVEIPTGRVVAHVGTHTWYHDPGFPLPDAIIQLTGLTDDVLKGHRLPCQQIADLLVGVDYILAQGAEFDRAFLAEAIPSVRTIPWLCSRSQIDWHANGHASAALPCLAKDHGFFYAAHRATIDAEVVIKVMAMGSRPEAPSYLSRLLEDIQCPVVMLAALNAPFSAKDTLKNRKWTWNDVGRFWYILVSPSAMAAEVEWITEHRETIGGRPSRAEIPIVERFDVSARSRLSFTALS